MHHIGVNVCTRNTFDVINTYHIGNLATLGTTLCKTLCYWVVATVEKMSIV